MTDKEQWIRPGERRRRRAVELLGVDLSQLHRLQDRLVSSLSVDVGGLVQLADIESFPVRAVASDLILTAAEAVDTNLIEAALHLRSYEEFVGPNGRAMPGPESTPDDEVEHLRAEADLVGFFRALGSALDCLAAATIGILRLPLPIQKAEGSFLAGGLGRLLEESHLESADSQREWAIRVSKLLDEHRSKPVGWLEWLVEMRNRLIHRSRPISTWHFRPSRREGQPPLLVKSSMDPAHLARYEPHLRAQPWRSEMDALRRPERFESQWFAEPAPATMHGLLDRLVRLSGDMADLLSTCLELDVEQTRDWIVDEKAWRIADAGPDWRLALADRFVGFDPDYPVPPPSSVRVSPRNAERLAIAERLRHAESPGGIA